MPPATKDTDRVARALIGLIDLIDCWRPSWRIFPGSSGHRIHLSPYGLALIALPSYSILEQYDPNFPKEIILRIREYGEGLVRESEVVQDKGPWLLVRRKYPVPDWKREKGFQDSIFGLGLFFVTVFLWYKLIVIFDRIIPDSAEYLFFAIFALVSVFLFFIATSLWVIRDKIVRGKIYDPDLLRMAQGSIDYAREYFKKNNIYPKDFPMKLAFNDYQGLTYEKKGRRYLAFVKID